MFIKQLMDLYLNENNDKVRLDSYYMKGLTLLCMIHLTHPIFGPSY